MYSRADLHCHSTVSDGVLDPETLARRAHASGVDLWSLTDHDEVSGVAQARQTARELGMAFVAGVEISVTWSGRTVHVVGLGIDENHQLLLDGLASTRSGRVDRGRLMGQKLAALGIPGAFEGALALAGEDHLLSRTHFARYLVGQGYCPTMQAVFDRYLGDDGPAYVPSTWADLGDAVDWIVKSGGVAVLAHPGRYKYSELQFDTLFRSFKDCGGLAIEVNTGSHQPHEYARYAQIARNYGFLASCGSDFHGPHESRELGSVAPLPADLTPVWQAISPDRIDVGLKITAGHASFTLRS